MNERKGHRTTRTVTLLLDGSEAQRQAIPKNYRSLDGPGLTH